MLSVVVDGEKSKTIPSRGLYKANVECSNGTTGEWDYNAWNLIINHAESNSKCNISFTSNLTQEEYDKYIEVGKALRRNTYRGKDITSYHTDGSLYEMIASGRFDDIYIGDYITANNIKWLVADIDNYLYNGYIAGEANSGALIKHHVTIVPASVLTHAAMNSTNTTEGGYANSAMKKTTLPSVLNTYVKPAFGNHVLTYNNLLTHSVNATAQSMAGAGCMGSSNGSIEVESQIDLMSEVNVYGIVSASSSVYDIGNDNKQYAIFRLKPELIITDGNGSSGIRFNYWLKGVYDNENFTLVYGDDHPGGTIASRLLGVRPRFLIG